MKILLALTFLMSFSVSANSFNEESVQIILEAEKVIEISPLKVKMLELGECESDKIALDTGNGRVFIVKTKSFETNLYITSEGETELKKCSTLRIW